MKIEIQGWHIQALVDDDGHLTLVVKHEDGTKPFPLEADIENGEEWAERFSTPAIETAYENTL